MLLLKEIYKKYRSTLIILIQLTVPLIGSGLIENSNSFFATTFLAHSGQKILAAGALVSNLFVTLMVINWGIISAVSVLVSQRLGAGDHQGVSRVLKAGFYFGLILCLPMMLILWHADDILLFFGQQPDTLALAKPYFHALAWSVPADFCGFVIQQFIMGLGDTRMALLLSLTWVPLGIFANYVLMFGKFGLPALGIVGLGWGWTIAMYVYFIGMSLFLTQRAKYRRYWQGIKQSTKAAVYLRELLKIGLPQGAMYSVEVGFFMMLALLMGKVGSVALAANQIVMQFISLSFVVTYSLAQAITIRVGYNVGRRTYRWIAPVAYIGITLVVTFTTIVALIYWLTPESLIRWMIDLHNPANQTVITLAKQFMAFAALFEIIESARFCLFGALRGLKDTRFPMLVSLFTLWGIGLPLGYYLALIQGWQGMGLWIGLLMSVTTSAVLLWLRFQYLLHKTRRISFDAEALALSKIV